MKLSPKLNFKKIVHALQDIVHNQRKFLLLKTLASCMWRILRFDGSARICLAIVDKCKYSTPFVFLCRNSIESPLTFCHCKPRMSEIRRPVKQENKKALLTSKLLHGV